MSFNTTGIAKIRAKLENGPCLIAQLGALLSPDEKASGKLRSALEAEGILTQFGRDRTEVYALLPDQEAVFAEHVTEIRADKSPVQYRFAVQIAFSKNLKPSERIYLSTRPQVRYYVVGNDSCPPENATLIDEEFRTPGFNPRGGQTQKCLYDFERKIEKWCAKYHISREEISWTSVNSKNQDAKLDISKILREFIEAQPIEIRDRVNLTGTILQILLSHE